MALVALVGCASGPSDTVSRAKFDTTAFQGQYLSARADLEAGRYKSAVRRYAKLTGARDAATPRMLIELSHAQLRSGDFAAAAETARRVAQDGDAAWRAPALAVLGTAEHELARERSGANAWDKTAKAHLLRAAGALDEMLAGGALPDPAQTMKKRRAAIAEDLALFARIDG